MNRVQVEPALRGIGDGDMAGVNRIERAAEERDRAAMRVAAMRMTAALRMCRRVPMSVRGECDCPDVNFPPATNAD